MLAAVGCLIPEALSMSGVELGEPVWWKVGAAKLQGDLTLNWGGIEVRAQRQLVFRWRLLRRGWLCAVPTYVMGKWAGIMDMGSTMCRKSPVCICVW